MAMLLKGGLSASGFEVLLGDSCNKPCEHEGVVNSAAKALEDVKLLCSAAWDTLGNTWFEYNYAIRRATCGGGDFKSWHEISLFYHDEHELAGDIIQEYKWEINQRTVALIEAMGKWYDNLCEAAKNRSRAWKREYNRFCELHKQFARRFWEYAQLLGRAVPVI